MCLIEMVIEMKMILQRLIVMIVVVLDQLAQVVAGSYLN